MVVVVELLDEATNGIWLMAGDDDAGGDSYLSVALAIC